MRRTKGHRKGRRIRSVRRSMGQDEQRGNGKVKMGSEIRDAP